MIVCRVGDCIPACHATLKMRENEIVYWIHNLCCCKKSTKFVSEYKYYVNYQHNRIQSIHDCCLRVFNSQTPPSISLQSASLRRRTHRSHRDLRLCTRGLTSDEQLGHQQGPVHIEGADHTDIETAQYGYDEALALGPHAREIAQLPAVMEL